MAKFANDSVMDAALDKVATSTILCLNTAQPADRAAAISDNLIPEATPSFTGPVDGDTSGRKLTVDASNGNTADVTGTATHVSLADGTDLLYVTTCASQAITSGNTVNIGSWDIEISDPT